MEIYLKRLIEMSELNEKENWVWDGCDPISLNDIANAADDRIVESNEPYGDTWDHIPKPRPREYHIGRILYFVRHPEEIKNIEIDNKCFGMTIFPVCEILDGWHRLAAAIILGVEKIDVVYGGRRDIEDYLSGISEEKPVDDFVPGQYER